MISYGFEHVLLSLRAMLHQPSKIGDGGVQYLAFLLWKTGKKEKEKDE
jgi:hypothetical protein